MSKLRHPLPLLIVALAMLAGAVLRIDHIRDRSVVHTEMFVPGIPLPPDLAVPKPRMDLWTVITSTLSTDTHPPGYYVAMWFVTRFFGAGTLAMRLPPVVFGVASIGLIYWLGVLIGQRAPGCVAAVLLALNGYHIVWSKTARMYTMICFLGLLTTILLLYIARSTKRRPVLEFSYGALMLLGLCCHIFFWALLATQMIWVAVNAWSRSRPMPRLLNVQILAMILGSPLLAFAAYQSGNPVAFLSRNVPEMARQYLQFVYVVPGWDDSYSTNGTAALALAPQFIVPLYLFFALCLVLLWLGVGRLKAAHEQLLSQPASSFRAGYMVTALAAIATIVIFTAVAGHPPVPKPTLKYLKAMTVLPLLMLAGAFLLERSWSYLLKLSAVHRLKFLSGGPPLIWMLALGPFALLAAVSWIFRTLMDPRGLVYVAPYLLLVLASGMIALERRSRVLGGVVFVAVAALHIFSVTEYRDRLMGPLNFREFALKLEPHVLSTDLIFLRSDWDTTPILYYLAPRHFHLKARGFEEAARDEPGARVWTLLFHGESIPAGMSEALREYHEVDTLNVPLARAVLYCRSACQ